MQDYGERCRAAQPSEASEHQTNTEDLEYDNPLVLDVQQRPDSRRKQDSAEDA